MCACVCGGSAEAVVRETSVGVRPKARPQLKRRWGPTVSDESACFSALRRAGGERESPAFSQPPTH